MPFQRRVFSAGKLLVLGGALIATYLLFAAAAMRIALKAREVQIPDFANKTAAEATALATNLGLAIKVDDNHRVDPTIAAGRVLAQEPAAKSAARQQRSVRVWLSAGPRAAAVPALTGETERTAQLKLTQDGLELATISEIRSPSYPFDVVVAQDPDAKSASAKVALLVNRSEQNQTFVMPDLIGVNGERAAALLRGHGFRASIVGATAYPGIAPGTVIRQSPSGGFQIAPGESISIEVSR
jgi:eukaryotic-like serine/threonine-protein kinase